MTNPLPHLPKGFIRHDGGPCPVSGETLVLTQHRGGLIGGPAAARTWSYGPNDWWQHEGETGWDQRNHIVAYRIESHLP